MSTTDLAGLPDFNQLQEHLDAERKTIIKVNNYADEDDYVRSLEDATIVLDFITKIQTQFYDFFKVYPSLTFQFKEEYGPWQEFVERNNVLDLVFLDDCLFPQKEKFFFGQDGGLNPKIMDLHFAVVRKWIEEVKTNHETTQKDLTDYFNIDRKLEDLKCQCHDCVTDYRAKLRDLIHNECEKEVDDVKLKIEEALQTGERSVSDLYYGLQKAIDKKLHQVRYRLKRSTLNRLESQIKSMVKDGFTYPSEVAVLREKFLRPHLKGILVQEGLGEEFLSETDYKKFFTSIGSSLWKSENWIEREFEKTVRSVMVLKRKDISGTILQEYLGEFWVHSNARHMNRKIIYHMGPTNSGKTYHAIEALAKAKTGCYLAPLRLLAGELYDTLNHKDVKCMLLTGEEVIEVEGATHTSSTIEMARLQQDFDCCVIDEIQMITDSSRGWAWTRALVNIMAPEIHVCGDPSVLDLVQKVADLCGDTLEVKNYTRMTELQVENRPITVGNLEKNDALIVFSRRNALRFKSDLERAGFKVSVVYGRLSPEVRREMAKKFDNGSTDIMVSTDAIAMGMNLPVRRIVFSTLSKYINNVEHPITPSEIKQIAGRAGRFNKFPTGFVTCLTKVEDGLNQIQDALDSQLEQQTKCMVGPDLDIFSQVNNALESNGLKKLSLSEFLRLFNTMTFKKPFFCVDLKEMIELAETVEEADKEGNLSSAEIFGFACAPVNLGLMEHVQYYVWILNHYVAGRFIKNDAIDARSGDIDYLETSIKCVELYQWLARHFDGKNFEFDEIELLENKTLAIEKLNHLLSDRIVPTCASCGGKLADRSKFAICEECFANKRFARRGAPSRPGAGGSGPGRGGPSRPGGGPGGFKSKAGGSSRFKKDSKPGSKSPGGKARSKKRKFSSKK
ncbi:MAG: hypothetical protein COW01_10315 [Bdellovibrionales bacterium CG12_big_fil_rev_8_21_14_0_65_38_15]|nr:MAG: hypothetical protein COW79_07160 [Bdellovibrionales bacterium CG22_combo_CG10-13_8_21_14_all_38_13]PIQ54530.1 MAG: hypothetical protein COW01_10315 [Bdellovibrionales bacterium CG12_big_fil_rev_8_21_14_0_65_38_15]PIR29911.1 MAG: hypothetical protein COV38_08160 [Bdellovibrionales bacterium CG11_big_fil_rev_8_21_14_0_20_38_13]